MTNHEKLTLSPRDNGYVRRFTRVIEYIYANLDEDPARRSKFDNFSKDFN